MKLIRGVRRLITVGHFYGVAEYRKLADEMARLGGSSWELLVVAPSFVNTAADMCPIAFEQRAGGGHAATEAVKLHLNRRIHFMFYGAKLRRLLRERDWDIVYAVEEPFNLCGWQVALTAPKRAKFVFLTFQNIAKTYPFPYGAFERYSVCRSAGWLASGETVARTMLERGYGVKPHKIVPLGVDTDRFRPDRAVGAGIRERLGWAGKADPVVGYVGRFVEEKGINLLMRALSHCTTPWRALFVGSGPLERQLRLWAKDRGDQVRIVTGVHHSQVPDYLNAMDVLCVPSQSTRRWREQFGRAIVEAFACGVPVIGSDSGEVPYVMRGAGMVLGEKDEPAWANGIATLLSSPAKRCELARNGRDTALSYYSWPTVAARHLEFFEQLS